MQAALPVIYLAAGWWLARLGIDWRRGMARVLSLAVIPYVVVFHVAGAMAELAVLMLLALAWMVALFVLGRWLSRDPVDALCFCYLNIGWLGLPVAASTLGPQAVSLFTAFYIASSTLGNSLGPAWLRQQGHAPVAPSRTARRAAVRSTCLQAWRTPALRAFLAGLAALPLGPWLVAHLGWLNQGARFLLGLLGMMVLGSWLAHVPVRRAELLRALPRFALRALLSVCVLATLWRGARLAGLPPLTTGAEALILLSILPPAANIVVLETEVLQTGRSAPRIASGTVRSLGAIAVFVALGRGGA